MEIKPSNIFYSHDSILYRFKKRRPRENISSLIIGKTLDDLCDGICKVSHIPNIRITKKDGKWFTLDNRRLWVFHHYEAHLNTEGKSLTITANVVEYDPSHDSRFTTTNEGISIDIKAGNSPWGIKKITPVTPRVEEKNDESESSIALETKEEVPQNTNAILDAISVSNDKNAGVNETSNNVLSTGNAITKLGISASTSTNVLTTSRVDISLTNTTIGNTDEKESAASDTIGLTDDGGSLSAEEAANTRDKISPTHTAAVYKSDTKSLNGTSNEVTSPAYSVTSTNPEMFSAIDTDTIIMGGISAPTIAISIDESSPTEEAAIATGRKSEQINTSEGTTKCEMALSELAETTYGSERHKDQTRKRGFSENDTQFPEDCIEVKRLKTD